MSGGNEFFAERLRRLRKARGYTQSLIGERLGISRHAVAQWEAFRAAPDREKIPALARILGTTTDYLLTGHEAPHVAAIHRAIRAGASQAQLLAMIGAE